VTTHYHSGSRGPVEIASMNYNHLLNAHDKLVRSPDADLRQAEIVAMRAHLDAMEAEQPEGGE
jgi:hypothetical protein